mmetsp:Transcript_25452/g.47498  ORF Transcript_25452/g.47498 Transcript_25452/m.47498 type:complete len:234 (-) Transcript_25452:509-1210(-)
MRSRGAHWIREAICSLIFSSRKPLPIFFLVVTMSFKSFTPDLMSSKRSYISDEPATEGRFSPLFCFPSLFLNAANERSFESSVVANVRATTSVGDACSDVDRIRCFGAALGTSPIKISTAGFGIRYLASSIETDTLTRRKSRSPTLSRVLPLRSIFNVSLPATLEALTSTESIHPSSASLPRSPLSTKPLVFWFLSINKHAAFVCKDGMKSRTPFDLIEYTIALSIVGPYCFR